MELVVRNVPFGTESRKTSSRASSQPATASMGIARNAHAGSSTRKRKLSEKQVLAFAALQAKCPSHIKGVDLASLTVEEKAARAKEMTAVRVSERHHARTLTLLCSYACHAYAHCRGNIHWYNGYSARADKEPNASCEEERAETPSCDCRARWHRIERH